MSAERSERGGKCGQRTGGESEAVLFFTGKLIEIVRRFSAKAKHLFEKYTREFHCPGIAASDVYFRSRKRRSCILQKMVTGLQLTQGRTCFF